MTLLELINKINPEEHGVIRVCVRGLNHGDEIDNFYRIVLPVLRKHNCQIRLETNSNGLNGVWLSFDKYTLNEADHKIKSWGFHYKALLELCEVCDVKITDDLHNYILDKNGNVKEIVEVMNDV